MSAALFSCRFIMDCDHWGCFVVLFRGRYGICHYVRHLVRCVRARFTPWPFVTWVFLGRSSIRHYRTTRRPGFLRRDHCIPCACFRETWGDWVLGGMELQFFALRGEFLPLSVIILFGCHEALFVGRLGAAIAVIDSAFSPTIPRICRE